MRRQRCWRRAHAGRTRTRWSRALGDFYARETHLFEKDLGERALTHRLAVHLEQQFAGWDVDCDYNRLGERTLRLPQGIDRLDRRRSRQIGVSRYRRAPARRFRKTCSRSRSARRAITSRSSTTGTSCAALTDPHLWFAFRVGVLLTLGKNERRGVGGLCRRGSRSPAVGTGWPGGSGRRASGRVTAIRAMEPAASPAVILLNKSGGYHVGSLESVDRPDRRYAWPCRRPNGLCRRLDHQRFGYAGRHRRGMDVRYLRR